MKIFEQFVKNYEPSTNLRKPTKEMLEWYSDKLPKELLDFWSEYGFGNYGNGIIKVVDPSKYMDSFYLWIGGKNFTRLPVLVTGFGDIFYYRKLSGEEEDMNLLDIHYRNIEVCTYSLNEFFEGYIVDAELSKELLKQPLFEQAISKYKKLETDEIFFFEPALMIGGAEELKYVGKGSATIHQTLLFEMGN